MMYNGLLYIYIYVFIHYLVNTYHEKFIIIFIFKLIEFSFKIEILHFKVADTIAIRRVIIIMIVYRSNYGMLLW